MFGFIPRTPTYNAKENKNPTKPKTNVKWTHENKIKLVKSNPTHTICSVVQTLCCSEPLSGTKSCRIWIKIISQYLVCLGYGRYSLTREFTGASCSLDLAICSCVEVSSGILVRIFIIHTVTEMSPLVYNYLIGKFLDFEEISKLLNKQIKENKLTFIRNKSSFKCLWCYNLVNLVKIAVTVDNVVTWASWRLNVIPTTGLFVQQLVQANNKEKNQISICVAFCEGKPPLGSPLKGSVMRKVCPCHDVIMV